MLDIRSHIPPQIDDGAKSIGESIVLLEELKQQGCTLVILTLHFYPMSMNISDFKAVFASKYSALLQAIKDKDHPAILPGCEVFFFNSISTCTALDSLAING